MSALTFEPGTPSFERADLIGTGAAALSLSASAARSGLLGAALNISLIFQPEWEAQLQLAGASLVPAGATALRVIVWHRAVHGAPQFKVSVVEDYGNYTWLGTQELWQPCGPAADWEACVRVSDSLPSNRPVRVGLVVGHAVGVTHLDDILVEWVFPPAAPPSPLTPLPASPPPPLSPLPHLASLSPPPSSPPHLLRLPLPPSTPPTSTPPTLPPPPSSPPPSPPSPPPPSPPPGPPSSSMHCPRRTAPTQSTATAEDPASRLVLTRHSDDPQRYAVTASAGGGTAALTTLAEGLQV